MPAFKDLTGQKFGRWTALYRSEKRPSAQWYCRCECGTERIVKSRSLTSGRSASCGCYCKEQTSKRFANPEAAFNRVWSYYTLNAKNRNILWFLTKQEFRNLIEQPCYYTGRLPSMSQRTYSDSIPPFIHNGIDRLDSSKPYQLDNCVSCCAEINWLKSDLPVDEFYKLCNEVVKHRNGDF